MPNQKPWVDYSCRIPATDTEFGKGFCAPLQRVHHVAHIRQALQIIRDRRLRAGLVYDESKLRTSRTTVTWLSANTWEPGSIYGNVQFSFDWDDLVRGARIYWVEAITRYRPTAYRFLITDQDFSSHLEAYDPESGDGPLKCHQDKWYWNWAFTSEFMFTDDIPLASCKELRFVRHHPNICRLREPGCSEARPTPAYAASVTFAALLGWGDESLNVALTVAADDGSRQLHPDGADGVTLLTDILCKRHNPSVGSVATADEAKRLLRGALALYGGGRADAAKETAALLKDEALGSKTLGTMVRQHFALTSLSFEQ